MIAFESYNDHLLLNQVSRFSRDWFVFTEDIVGNLFDAYVAMVGSPLEDIERFATSIQLKSLNETDKKQRLAMAKIIVDGWIEDIAKGVHTVDDPKLLKELNEYEKRLAKLDEKTPKDEIINVLLEIVDVFSKYPGLNSAVELCANIAGEIDTGVGFFKDAYRRDILIEIECCKAEMAKDLLEQLALSEGLDDDIKVAVDALINSSTNIWLKTLKFTAAPAYELIDSGLSAVVGGELATVTCGLSVAFQMSYNGFVESTVKLATGQSDIDGFKKYLTETDNYAETLENALDIYLARTKPQLVEALDAFKKNPTSENYKAINNSNHSGKLQSWAMQTKQVSKLYYATKGLAAVGDENYYARHQKQDENTIFFFVATITKGL